MTDKEAMMDGPDTNPEPEGVKPEAPAGEAASKDEVIARLEQIIAGKDSDIATLKEAASDTEKRLDDLGNALAKAVASYNALVIKSNPGVLAELISGNTIDEVDESLKNAQLIIDRVRQEMEAEASKIRVPAGAPQRLPFDLSVLSPREKIQYAIGGKK